MMMKPSAGPISHCLCGSNRGKSMIIGVPKEIKTDEFLCRSMTPVMELIKAGHSVMVEQGAGLGSWF